MLTVLLVQTESMPTQTSQTICTQTSISKSVQNGGELAGSVLEDRSGRGQPAPALDTQLVPGVVRRSSLSRPPIGVSGGHMPQAPATSWEAQTKGPHHTPLVKGLSQQSRVLPQPREEGGKRHGRLTTWQWEETSGQALEHLAQEGRQDTNMGMGPCYSRSGRLLLSSHSWGHQTHKGHGRSPSPDPAGHGHHISHISAQSVLHSLIKGRGRDCSAPGTQLLPCKRHFSLQSWAQTPDVTPPESQDSGGNLSLRLSQAHYSELGAAWTTR